MRSVINYDDVLNSLCYSTQKYIRENKIKNVVLGLSGGIDSTVTAAIVYLTKKKYPDLDCYVIGVSLPSSTNEIEEQRIAGNSSCFCDEYCEHNIQDEYEVMRKATSEYEFNTTPISLGNIKARIRMMHLYNVANVRKGIVLDTDNLTEHHLGFFTIHGDVGDFNIIGDLWKSEVYELAKHIRTKYLPEPWFEVLDDAIIITPTDGNGVKSGGDMEQIAPGCTYSEVDTILSMWITDKFTKQEIIDWCKTYLVNVSEDNVLRIINRNESTWFKRKHMPIKINIPEGVFSKY